MEKITFEVGDVVYLKSDFKKNHPLTIKEFDYCDSTDYYDIECVGITQSGKRETYHFDNPHVLMKREEEEE